MGQQLERPIRGFGQEPGAEAGHDGVVGRRLADDGLGLLAQRRRDRRPVVEELAERRVAGQHAVHGPLDRDGGRSGVDQGVGGPAQDRPPRVGLRELRAASRQGKAGGGDLAERRRAAHDHLPDRLGHVAGRFADDLDQLVGEPALVDEHEAILLQPERAHEAGRDHGSRGRGRAATGGRGAALREDAVRDLLGRVAQGPSRSHEGRGGANGIARQHAEEAASLQTQGLVGRGRRRGTSGRRAGSVEVAHGRGTGPGRGRSDRSISTGSPR